MRKKRGGALRSLIVFLEVLLCTCAILTLAILGIWFWKGEIRPNIQVMESLSESSPNEASFQENSAVSAEESVEESSDVVPELPFEAHCVEGTEPDRYLAETHIYINGDEVETYQAQESIDMRDGDGYAKADGIFTFRGNNFRSHPVVGHVSMSQKKFDTDNSWNYSTSYMLTPDGSVWTGNGWTGQPLMRVWSQTEKQHMNMYDWAKEKDGLVEVIYASLDGYVYFLDLDTGEETREPLNIGYTFKGAGTLDPRGYPILYVGSGYLSGDDNASKVFIINLLDCSVMYTFGSYEEEAPRSVPFWDSSALICAETDQLIYPGENGILHILKLNTQYDPESGTLSIAPDPMVMWTYLSNRWMWLGMEDSAVIYRHYLYVSDNGGNLICLDLNTLEPVWVQDVWDDTNCSPVLDIEDGKPYLYISTSYHAGWRGTEDETVEIPILKIDAETGEVVWSITYDCWTIEDLSGGVQGTLALGEGSLSDYIYVPVSRTPWIMDGTLAAISKATGEVVWEHSTGYSWSSPVCVYDESGKGYVINGDFNGDLHLVDGLTGECLDCINLGSNIEASPAVYGNRLVVGTRGQLIWGVTFR